MGYWQAVMPLTGAQAPTGRSRAAVLPGTQKRHLHASLFPKRQCAKCSPALPSSSRHAQGLSFQGERSDGSRPILRLSSKTTRRNSRGEGIGVPPTDCSAWDSTLLPKQVTDAGTPHQQANPAISDTARKEAPKPHQLWDAAHSRHEIREETAELQTKKEQLLPATSLLEKGIIIPI
uniref:Uncharacterized protein n=1 Tax=Sphaerodactylus townsendi TaxID=933632 RepID=A0ACB8EE52_9SAUR